MDISKCVEILRTRNKGNDPCPCCAVKDDATIHVHVNNANNVYDVNQNHLSLLQDLLQLHHNRVKVIDIACFKYSYDCMY